MNALQLVLLFVAVAVFLVAFYIGIADTLDANPVDANSSAYSAYHTTSTFVQIGGQIMPMLLLLIGGAIVLFILMRMWS